MMEMWFKMVNVKHVAAAVSKFNPARDKSRWLPGFGDLVLLLGIKMNSVMLTFKHHLTDSQKRQREDKEKQSAGVGG